MSTATYQHTVLRKPTRADGKALYQLVKQCPPLDLNSPYAYLILCEHFADTCVVAEREGRLVGCVTGYIPPNSPDTLFVWQVAVDSSARGHGIGGAMVRDLVTRGASSSLQFLETTVSPSNTASARMFESFAAKLNACCERQVLFSREDFGSSDHEDEVLFRIGPFTTRNESDLRTTRTNQKENYCANE
jgi:L-2,4-diaminobutyric acid acetyltransferase